MGLRRGTAIVFQLCVHNSKPMITQMVLVKLSESKKQNKDTKEGKGLVARRNGEIEMEEDMRGWNVGCQ